MKENNKNPFEFEAANNLSEDEILDYYIDDYNYSRFINTTRNIFLQGARGTGKTMSLLFNSFKIKHRKYQKLDQNIDYSKIGIYIPCNTPLFHKKEYLLFANEFQAQLINEHYLVLTIVNSIASTLNEIPDINKECNKPENELKEYLEYVLSSTLPDSKDFLNSVSMFTQRETTKTQELINRNEIETSFSDALTFSSFVIPFFNCLKKVETLKNSHFSLLIDDAHDLNKYQKQIINSWIAYRDHSQFSFKIATAESNPYFITSNGGMILEGHDFISVDMLKPYQNRESEFGKLARKIINQRLQKYGISSDADSFFPVSESFSNDIIQSRNAVKEQAKLKFGEGTGTQISDYVSKYTRAHYFKSRPSKANLPPYSGLDTIIDISTGVIRNLLDPCFGMYDAALSKITNSEEKLDSISASIQQEILVFKSKKLWERLEFLNKSNPDCTEEQAKHIFNLFQNLMVHFKDRLMSELSEPRTVTFVITSQNQTNMEYINQLLEIVLKAQLLFTRHGKDKRTGKKTTVFVPNRLLLLTYGLDPHGQYASASIKAYDILNAIKNNKKIPLPKIKTIENDDQKTLFDKS